MNKNSALTIERHPFSTFNIPRWVVVAHETDGKSHHCHHVPDSPTDLNGCVIFKLQQEMPDEKGGDDPTQGEVNAEVIRTLHAMAEEQMKVSDSIGEAWLYIYEKTGDDTRSIAWVVTQLLRAVNDPNVASLRKKVYVEIVDSLG